MGCSGSSEKAKRPNPAAPAAVRRAEPAPPPPPRPPAHHQGAAPATGPPVVSAAAAPAEVPGSPQASPSPASAPTQAVERPSAAPPDLAAPLQCSAPQLGSAPLLGSAASGLTGGDATLAAGGDATLAAGDATRASGAEVPALAIASPATSAVDQGDATPPSPAEPPAARPSCVESAPSPPAPRLSEPAPAPQALAPPSDRPASRGPSCSDGGSRGASPPSAAPLAAGPSGGMSDAAFTASCGSVAGGGHGVLSGSFFRSTGEIPQPQTPPAAVRQHLPRCAADEVPQLQHRRHSGGGFTPLRPPLPRTGPASGDGADAGLASPVPGGAGRLSAPPHEAGLSGVRLAALTRSFASDSSCPRPLGAAPQPQPQPQQAGPESGAGDARCASPGSGVGVAAPPLPVQQQQGAPQGQAAAAAAAPWAMSTRAIAACTPLDRSDADMLGSPPSPAAALPSGEIDAEEGTWLLRRGENHDPVATPEVWSAEEERNLRRCMDAEREQRETDEFVELERQALQSEQAAAAAAEREALEALRRERVPPSRSRSHPCVGPLDASPPPAEQRGPPGAVEAAAPEPDAAAARRRAAAGVCSSMPWDSRPAGEVDGSSDGGELDISPSPAPVCTAASGCEGCDSLPDNLNISRPALPPPHSPEQAAGEQASGASRSASPAGASDGGAMLSTPPQPAPSSGVGSPPAIAQVHGALSPEELEPYIHRSLPRIDLSTVRLKSPGGAAALATYLQAHGAEVTELLLGGCQGLYAGLSPEDALTAGEELARSVASCSEIRVLDLSGCPLSLLAVAALSPLPRRLREIRMKDCRLSADAAERVMRAAAGGLDVQRLDLSGNPFGDQGVRQLSGAVPAGARPPLVTLRLQRCGVTGHGVQPLGVLVRKLGCLRELAICQNALGSEGSGALRHVLLITSLRVILAEECGLDGRVLGRTLREHRIALCLEPCGDAAELPAAPAGMRLLCAHGNGTDFEALASAGASPEDRRGGAVEEPPWAPPSDSGTTATTASASVGHLESPPRGRWSRSAIAGSSREPLGRLSRLAGQG
eukprot:TRINITY_DN3408_c1_g1_i2.p1 TRINITY_DN3408_c1_g1~~TRINITY_DN3408_c1_g1_i2.p1  ORF type:complete len:1076 (+),score=181.27 TRINITY_DN3408_c1_g1_i2:82-3228(+)